MRVSPYHAVAETSIFHNIWFQIALLIVFATFHGYAGAWLAVRMLFRPRNPVKFLGIPIFPQGMIPRHRERLAAAIGKAVGEELVSTDTIHEQLIEKDFLRNKIQSVVDSYTDELLVTGISVADRGPASERSRTGPRRDLGAAAQTRRTHPRRSQERRVADRDRRVLSHAASMTFSENASPRSLTTRRLQRSRLSR